jgi:hypothetical protein
MQVAVRSSVAKMVGTVFWYGLRRPNHISREVPDFDVLMY